MAEMNGHLWRPQAGSPAPAAGPADLRIEGTGFRAGASGARLTGTDERGWQYLVIGTPYERGRPLDPPVDLRGLVPDDPTRAARLGGSHAIAGWHERSRTLLLVTDRFASVPLYWAEGPGGLAFGTAMAAVADAAGLPRALDPQALYDYLFFSVVPSNRSVIRGIRKLPAATMLVVADGHAREVRYWEPDFRRHPERDDSLRAETVERIGEAVARYANLDGAGCFLSGGLDSSTVSGLAARARSGPTPAFTIGYDVEEFDESHYARITARHFGLELHEHRIRSEDIADHVTRVVNGFEEPFGNPSAVSAYLCAHFASGSGVRHMLAGDGGDEIFGGNERYQKQAVFGLYGALPAWLRAAVVDPLAALTAAGPSPLPKLASYVRQASVPLPDRLFSYNLLVRNDPASVLTPEFLRTVDVSSPYAYARGIFGAPRDGDALDRMLYLDWTTTLTDNDLPKVMVACRLAGVTPHFPLLDPDVVDVSIRVPSRDKLTLRELRLFYKRAFKGILPDEILTKPKHGFGVPVGIWVNRDPALRERIGQKLDALGRRGIVRADVVGELLRLQATDHASYYGALLWPLFALEEWLQGHGF